jgi:hypothetical protein
LNECSNIVPAQKEMLPGVPIVPKQPTCRYFAARALLSQAQMLKAVIPTGEDLMPSIGGPPVIHTGKF